MGDILISVNGEDRPIEMLKLLEGDVPCDELRLTFMREPAMKCNTQPLLWADLTAEQLKSAQEKMSAPDFKLPTPEEEMRAMADNDVCSVTRGQYMQNRLTHYNMFGEFRKDIPHRWYEKWLHADGVTPIPQPEDTPEAEQAPPTPDPTAYIPEMAFPPYIRNADRLMEEEMSVWLQDRRRVQYMCPRGRAAIYEELLQTVRTSEAEEFQTTSQIAFLKLLEKAMVQAGTRFYKTLTPQGVYDIYRFRQAFDPTKVKAWADKVEQLLSQARGQNFTLSANYINKKLKICRKGEAVSYRTIQRFKDRFKTSLNKKKDVLMITALQPVEVEITEVNDVEMKEVPPRENTESTKDGSVPCNNGGEPSVQSLRDLTLDEPVEVEPLSHFCSDNFHPRGSFLNSFSTGHAAAASDIDKTLTGSNFYPTSYARLFGYVDTDNNQLESS